MIDDFSIPVSVDKLPPSYSILFPDVSAVFLIIVSTHLSHSQGESILLYKI